jgi:hypothetical protein
VGAVAPVAVEAKREHDEISTFDLGSEFSIEFGRNGPEQNLPLHYRAPAVEAEAAKHRRAAIRRD